MVEKICKASRSLCLIVYEERPATPRAASQTTSIGSLGLKGMQPQQGLN